MVKKPSASSSSLLAGVVAASSSVALLSLLALGARKDVGMQSAVPGSSMLRPDAVGVTQAEGGLRRVVERGVAIAGGASAVEVERASACDEATLIRARVTLSSGQPIAGAMVGRLAHPMREYQLLLKGSIEGSVSGFTDSSGAVDVEGGFSQPASHGLSAYLPGLGSTPCATVDGVASCVFSVADTLAIQLLEVDGSSIDWQYVVASYQDCGTPRKALPSVVPVTCRRKSSVVVPAVLASPGVLFVDLESISESDGSFAGLEIHIRGYEERLIDVGGGALDGGALRVLLRRVNERVARLTLRLQELDVPRRVDLIIGLTTEAAGALSFSAEANANQVVFPVSVVSGQETVVQKRMPTEEGARVVAAVLAPCGDRACGLEVVEWLGPVDFDCRESRHEVSQDAVGIVEGRLRQIGVDNQDRVRGRVLGKMMEGQLGAFND